MDFRLSRSLQRFPQIYENSFEDFRSNRSSTLRTRSSPHENIPITISRSRSYSASQNQTLTTPTLIRNNSYQQFNVNYDIDRRTRKITQRIAELFALIQENRSDQYE